MLNERELLHIILVTIVLVFAITFKQIINLGVDYIYLATIFVFIMFIILINLLAKKYVAYKYEANLETQIWNWQRFGFKRHHYFKNPIPVGIIAPTIITVLTLGNFLFLASLESKIEGTSARASKSHGRFRFTEMTDSHISFISGAGVIANLILAIIAYLINLGQLAELSIYYAFYSIIPFGNLDGMKILMGNKNYWFALVIITLLFLSYALFLPK